MINAHSFTLFHTAIGVCGVVWSDQGLVGVQLPESSLAHTRQRVQRRFPDALEGAPTDDVRAAIEGIGALLRGEKRDLAEVKLDMSGVPLFNRRVYELARRIPPGSTLTYGEIASRL